MCRMWICLLPETARQAMNVCWLWAVPYFICLLSSRSWAWVSRSLDFNTWEVEKSVLVAQSCPTLCNPVAHQAPLFMGFSRQEYWSGLPFSSPGDLPNPGIKPGLPNCGQILYCLSHQESGTGKWCECCCFRFLQPKSIDWHALFPNFPLLSPG